MKQMDTLLFQHGQSIDEIKNRLNCIETGAGSDFVPGDGSNEGEAFSKEALMSDPEFVNGIVDNIMTNSNLSEIIEQIDAVQTENRELRELFYAQQKTINEMNIMLLKLFAQSVTAPAPAATVAAPIAVSSAAAVAEEVHQEEVHQEEVHHEEVHHEEVHQEEVHQEEVHQEEVHQEEEAHQEE